MVLLSSCAFNPRMEQPMSFSSLWKWIGGPSRPARKPAGRRPAVEALEDRAVPTTLVALTNRRELLTFDSAQPTAVLSTVAVRGVPTTETLLGIDTRPSTGQLYATSDRALYTLDTTTGRATLIATYATARPGLVATGLDFNPVVDRLRVTTTSGKNLRVNPDTGAVTVDTALAYATGDPNAGQKPAIVGSAYTNPDNDTLTSTALFGIDFQRNALVSQANPNNGQLTTVGALGVDVSAFVGFDIASGAATGFAAMSTAAAPKVPHLYTINLATGAATDAGLIGAGNKAVIGLAAVLPAQPVYAVTNTNQLVTFNAAAPEIITSSRAITGLSAGENLTGIDFRPSTGELYGTSSLNRVYVINTVTGAATRVNGAVFSGDQFGVDFNPVADALRIVSDTEQNLRITSGGRGTVNSDTALIYALADANFGDNPNVVGAAYDNNFPGATTTTLFGIDTFNNTLVRIGDVAGTPSSPNTGELHTIGATGLGVDPDAADFVGFDISSGGTAYSAMRLTGQTVSRFFTINLTTGVAAAVQGTAAVGDGVASNEGIIGSLKGGSPTIVGIAVAPPLVHFQTVTPSFRENVGNARLVVTRSGDTTATAVVGYTLIPETAKAPDDFTAMPGTVTFDPGETFASFEVPIINDTADEPNETFAAALTKTAADTFTIDPALAQAIVTIIDND
jgi:hypothetical protein